MKRFVMASALACAVASGAAGTTGFAQGTPTAAAQVHVEAAKKAAGTDFSYLFSRTCGQLTPAPRAASAQPRQPGPPPRASNLVAGW